MLVILNTLSTLKMMYKTNKRLFLIMVVVIGLFLFVSCTSGGSSGGSAPSGPIGGGCG